MMIFHKELSLDEGFAVLAADRADRNIDGVKISAPSGVSLWKTCREKNLQMKCWTCGVEADRFILKQHRKESNKTPVLELYAHTGAALVMMTRDHIIPVSLGGVNHVDNLRPACEPCNNKRKNSMTNAELKFMKDNQHLWGPT